MEEGDVLVPKPCAMAPLWVHFGFRPDDKGRPSHVEEAIRKVCCQKRKVNKCEEPSIDTPSTAILRTISCSSKSHSIAHIHIQDKKNKTI